jgi:5,10-methylenetetrahydromethanopterin reductase
VYASLTLVALHTRHMQIGTMVTDPYSRHLALTAMALATLDELAGGRAILGLGAGVAGFAAMQLTPRQPAQAMRKTVAVVRSLLRGETVDMQGEVIALTHGRLDFPPFRPQVLVYIASRGSAGAARCRNRGGTHWGTQGASIPGGLPGVGQVQLHHRHHHPGRWRLGALSALAL